MHINEAAEKAISENRCMTVPEFKGEVKIMPTNEAGNCVLMNADGSHCSKYGWQPSAKDLMRNDWQVVD